MVTMTDCRQAFCSTETPMVAIMEIRPCFNSTDRRRLKVATSPSEVNPTGSQKPTGACTPSSFSKASQADPCLIAKSPNALPVKPSCKHTKLSHDNITLFSHCKNKKSNIGKCASYCNASCAFFMFRCVFTIQSTHYSTPGTACP